MASTKKAMKPMTKGKAMQTTKTMKTKGKASKDKGNQLPMQPTPPLQFMAIHCTGKDCPSWVWLHRLATMGSCQVCGRAWATSVSNIQLHL